MTPQLNPQFAARALAAQGRGDDTELVHMSPKEVASLQALAQKHGIASLTRNPSTGLVEAGALSAILPAVAGIGLSLVAPEIAPALIDMGMGADAAGATGAFLGSGVGAGLTVGGIDALATGSMKQGLMAGLGAYGGATMASGLSPFSGATPVSASAPVASGTDALGATGAVGESGVQGAAASANMAATTPGAYAGVPAQGAFSGAASGAPSGISALPTDGSAASTFMNSALPNTTAGSNVALGMGTDPTSIASQGLQSVPLSATTGASPDIAQQLAANSAQGPFATDNYNRLFNAAAMAAPYLGATPTAAKPTDLQNLENTVRPYTFKETPNRLPGMPGDAASPYFTQQFTALPTYVAGQQPSTMPVTTLAGGGLARGEAKGETLRGTLGQLHGVEKLTHFADGGNTGGISSLGSYSDGGRLLRGPGDGVSDSIPAQIGQHQPARLAEGEFVVPARIVSELGNGSTNAGAKRLYAMLDRIQAGRGKTLGKNAEYAKDTNPSKHLPA